MCSRVSHPRGWAANSCRTRTASAHGSSAVPARVRTPVAHFRASRRLSTWAGNARWRTRITVHLPHCSRRLRTRSARAGSPTPLPLQTPDYARAVMRNTGDWDEEQVERLVNARTARLGNLGR
ncbi:Scr1 family TA system antitoxin-like transcriptional regulator [Lipingzhangella halophila]|uniref:Scr1 family TA system antitoxin-like transcriptional regulator n=1 Tax=Lipingzhangella halophila TaxID=1783352 RepID=UPI0035E46478